MFITRCESTYIYRKLSIPVTSTKCGSEIRELQRSIKIYDMQYFPQHVLLCTSTVHDQSENNCIQGYLRILWIRNKESSKID